MDLLGDIGGDPFGELDRDWECKVALLLPPSPTAPKKPAGAVAVMVGMGGGTAPLLPANGTAKPGTDDAMQWFHCLINQ